MYEIKATVTKGTSNDVKLIGDRPVAWLQAPDSIDEPEILHKLIPGQVYETFGGANAAFGNLSPGISLEPVGRRRGNSSLQKSLSGASFHAPARRSHWSDSIFVRRKGSFAISRL